MPGAFQNIVRAEMPARGMRRPNNIGYLNYFPDRTLQPFMAHPLRPGETLVDVDLQGESWFMHHVNQALAPITFSQVALWVVPMSAYPAWFKQIFTSSQEDFDEFPSDPSNAGMATKFTFDAEADQGYYSVGAQGVQRDWAGEHGPQYYPYTSFGVKAIAEAWYEQTAQDQSTSTIADLPPRVAEWIRTMTGNGLDIGGVNDPDPNAVASLSELIEGLFLLGKTDQTYAEYLAGHSVNPLNVDGMPMPILIEDGILTARDPQVISGVKADDIASPGVVAGTVDESWVSATFDGVTTDLDDGLVYDGSPVGPLYKRWNRTRRRNLFIEEPSVLIGTQTWWTDKAEVENGGHRMDIGYLQNAGMWGDRSQGAVEESDFLAILGNEDLNGVNVNNRVLNALHLFLYGDVFGYRANWPGSDDEAPNEYRFVGGGVIPPISQKLQSKFSCRLNILSDLVG